VEWHPLPLHPFPESLLSKLLERTQRHVPVYTTTSNVLMDTMISPFSKDPNTIFEPLESELAIQVEYDMDEQDQEWLDVLNAERKKEQLDRISYEAFEIVMDRLEKEWFDLVCDDTSCVLALTCIVYRRKTSQNLTLHCHQKTRHAQSAMTQRERILTPSCSVMGAILLFIKIVTAFLISQKASGYVESVPCPPRILCPVFSARTRAARLNKLSMVNGFTYCARSGFPRRVLRMRSLWSPLLGLSVYQSNAGN